MTNKTKIFSELSKIAVEAMNTFSSFKKEIETKIFALTPPFYKPVKLTIPSFYLYANGGDIAKTRNIDSIKHLFPNTEFIPFDGGHLFPLEQTEKCGKEIVSILRSQKNKFK